MSHIYIPERTSFMNAHLEGATIIGCDLRGASFMNACLNGVRFVGSMTDRELEQLVKSFRADKCRGCSCCGGCGR